MKTLQQIRAQVYDKLRETSGTDSHFTDSQINGYINEGVEYLGVFIEYPRDLVGVAVEANIGDYLLPSDNLFPRTAYFGDRTVPGDCKPLTIISEETLKELYPNWLDQTSTTQGRPQYFIIKNRKTLSVFPRPDASNVGTNKKIWMNYGYVPTSLAQDSDTPDLPVPYHNLVQFYALHLAFIFLQNTAMSEQMLTDFSAKLKAIKSTVTKETKEGQAFQWGSDVDVDASQAIVNP